FIYGLACTIDHWRHQRRHFDHVKVASQVCRQLWLDYRGQGLSERPPRGQRLSMDMIAGDIIELCRLRGIEKLFVLGQSMGGCLALRVAERAPEMVKGIVLLASPSRDPILELPLQPVSPLVWRGVIALNDQ